MKKTVVVSTNNNPDYFFYAPFAEYAWNKLGWNLCIMVTNDVNIKDIVLNNPLTILCKLPAVDGIRNETMAQAGRLYASNYLQSEMLIMTSDMDLIPLSDYWHPNENDITVYGHDLTWNTYYPMGYICMSIDKWKHVMMINHNTREEMERDFKETKIAYSEKWEDWWNVDWDLITKRLKPIESQITFINRGRRTDSQFAYGRIDRGDSMKIIPRPWIDAHCENNNVRHPDKLNKFLDIFNQAWGEIPKYQ
jgi:hypothetical protein